MLTSQNPDPNARRTFILFRPFIAVWHWLFPPTLAHRDRQSNTSRIIAAVAIVVVCVAWAIFEFISGAPFWGMIAGGFAAYAVWQFFILYKPVDPAAAQPPETRE